MRNEFLGGEAVAPGRRQPAGCSLARGEPENVVLSGTYGLGATVRGVRAVAATTAAVPCSIASANRSFAVVPPRAIVLEPVIASSRSETQARGWKPNLLKSAQIASRTVSGCGELPIAHNAGSVVASEGFPPSS
jgi:hypothetical protein